MMKGVYIGIDLGQKGAICVLCENKVIAKYPMPLERDKKTVNVIEINKILSKYEAAFGSYYIKMVGFENILQPIFGCSKGTSIQMGRQFGQIETIMKLKGLSYKFFIAKSWQSEMFKEISEIRNKKNKRDTKAMALESYKKLFPNEKFVFTKRQKTHDGLIDACVIAAYLQQLKNG